MLTFHSYKSLIVIKFDTSTATHYAHFGLQIAAAMAARSSTMAIDKRSIFESVEIPPLLNEK